MTTLLTILALGMAALLFVIAPRLLLVIIAFAFSVPLGFAALVAYVLCIILS